jgi:hypothetical protein
MKSTKFKTAWSVGCLICLGLFLPNFEPSRGASGTLTQPPTRLIMLMLIGFPLLAATVWIPTRYSLRTLLIAMTVAAFTLAFVTAAARY